MDTGLADKVVLITGAAAGMGREMAKAFAGERSRVVVADIDDRRGAESVELIRSAGAQGDFFHLDVSDRSAVFSVVAEIEKRHGPVDVLVNNAGIITMGAIEELTEADWDHLQAINVKGPLFCIQAVVPAMRKKGGGRIINVCSVVSKMAGSMPYAHYSASKAALWSLTMSAAREFAPIPITVNGVAPGSIVNTDFSKDFNLSTDPEVIGRAIPMRRRGDPFEVAPAVVFLASDAAAYITGELIDVNGGLLMD